MQEALQAEKEHIMQNGTQEENPDDSVVKLTKCFHFPIMLFI